MLIFGLARLVVMFRFDPTPSPKDFDSDIKQIVQDVKADHTLLKLVKGVISKHKKMKQQRERLHRGVNNLKSVPDYIVRSALSRLTSMDESIFRNLDMELDCRGLFYYLLGGDIYYKLPRLEMTLEEFWEWLAMRAGELQLVAG